MARYPFRNLLSVLILLVCAGGVAVASEFHGRLTFNGLPLPGATVTAERGAKKIVTASDQSGIFTFDDLSDGAWKIVIEMQCFAAIHEEVTVAKGTPAGKWEMKLLPLDQVKATVQVPQTALSSASVVSAVAPLIPRKKAEAGQPAPASEIPRPEDQSENSEKAADGFLVNGSVSNAATSQYAMDRAFGNTRKGSKGIYNYGFASILENSALDARPYSLTGRDTPKDLYDRVTMILTFGGPIKIPRLLPRGPNFFASYQWTRNNTAQLLPGIVPTADERAGIIAGKTYTVDQSAEALLQYYPSPNITGTSLYNYQAQVLNSSHQDVFQTRLDRNIGNKNGLYGGFNLQSTRAGSTNFFGFVDTTDTLGLDGHVNWWHRFSMRHYMNLGYHISRVRTEVVPNFANRKDVDGNALIAGGDPDAADWGPPTLSFSSGIAGLSDATSSFNRNRTDSVSASTEIYHGHHNVTVGGDFRKLEYNDYFQQNPEGSFAFTGAASGVSDFVDFLSGKPDTASVAWSANPDRYLREPVYDAYITDDWRLRPGLTLNVGLRWEDSEPISELKGRLVNLDIASGFTAEDYVLGSDPTDKTTGNHFPSSLVRPDRRGIEPRVGFAWRPIPASTVVVRAGYGIYRDSSVYQSSALQMTQQAPLSNSFSRAYSTTCPLTLESGLKPCSNTDPTVVPQTFAMDPNFRIGYAQTWQLAVQRDLPGALQMTATYLGIKGTHGVQEYLPNTYPIGETNPHPGYLSGYAYRTSGGNSTRESGQLQLRRRLRSGFTATLLYTFSKSIDDDAYLGGQGQAASSGQSDAASASIAGANASIAQDWIHPDNERSLSSFDQRHLVNLQAQYTSGEGLKGGTLLTGWRGRVLKEWTIVSQLSAGSGLPETPIYSAAVPGTAFTGTIRASTTGAPVYRSASGSHLNPAAYSAPAAGQWGTAGRNSITGPNQFSLDSAMARTFRPNSRIYLDFQVSATNLLNHTAFTGWNTTVNSIQFGSPVAANPMRSLQTTLRMRF